MNTDIHTRMMARILIGFVIVLILSFGIGLWHGDPRTKLIGIFVCLGYMICMVITLWMSKIATDEEHEAEMERRSRIAGRSNGDKRA